MVYTLGASQILTVAVSSFWSLASENKLIGNNTQIGLYCCAYESPCIESCAGLLKHTLAEP